MNRLSVKQAASLLGCAEQFVRLGLQQGTLPIGWAVKTSSQYTYVIPKSKFEEVTKIKANKNQGGRSVR